jgi:hypothetical protein
MVSEEVVRMAVQEQVNIIMAGLCGEMRELLNDVDRGLVDRDEAVRIVTLATQNATDEIIAILPLAEPGEISYRAG